MPIAPAPSPLQHRDTGGGGTMRRLLVLLAMLLAGPALAQKDALTVDLPGDAATLDPHVQWDTDSYTIYRNIFDNLVTRDPAGKIVPQIATAWRYADDLSIVVYLRGHVACHDG